MTVWRYSVSWSKFKLALDCPLALQYTIDKKPHGRSTNTYYQALGTIVQFCFEQYFNQKVNLREGGQKDETMAKVAAKILNSNYVAAMQITYPHNKTEEDLRTEATTQIMSGFETLKQMGLTKYQVRSEVKLNGVFRGFRLFALVDFLREGESGDYIFDGKGHSQKNADPRQVVYYALNRAASGRKIAGGGLIYWKHGFEPVDLSPAALRRFIDNEFAEARPIFEKLKLGLDEDLPAKPSEQTCRWCNWRNTCEFSLVKEPPQQEGLPDEVDFNIDPTPV